MKPFNAWKEGLVLYGPLLGAGAALALLGGAWYASVPLLALGLCTLAFFRDPRRTVAAAPHEIVCPADGRVVEVADVDATPYYEGRCRRVSIFLSVLDVHVNRSPFDGTVGEVHYRPGRFKNAMKAIASECNESNAVQLETNRGPMVVRQISGAIARRIVCRAAAGDRLHKGEKFGMIRFGSRTELYVPAEARLCVSVRDRVRAGTTVVARFES